MCLIAQNWGMARPEQDYNPLDETDDVPRVDPGDPFSPPQDVCECYCLHCGRTFLSDGIWLQRYRQPPRDSMKGFWMCPTPNCDGRGFTFDIFPTDPEHPCNASWSGEGDYADDPDDLDGPAFDEEELLDPDLSIDEDPDELALLWDADDPEAEYDPDEPQYKALEADIGLGDGDGEGEEWKQGLLPGDYPLDFMLENRQNRDDPRRDPRFDQPDRRPREIDYVDADYRYNEDDIPF
jgi:hypothetical protein